MNRTKVGLLSNIIRVHGNTEVSQPYRLHCTGGPFSNHASRPLVLRYTVDIIRKGACLVGWHKVHCFQCEALERELQFHKSVYTLQVGYVESLFEAVRWTQC